MHADTALLDPCLEHAAALSLRKSTPEMRSQPIQDDVRRSLKDHIRHEEDGQGDVKLVALELEVFCSP